MANHWKGEPRRYESVMNQLLSIYSAHGFGGGGWQCCLGIITHDLQLARGRDGIVTYILC